MQPATLEQTRTAQPLTVWTIRRQKRQIGIYGGTFAVLSVYL